MGPIIDAILENLKQIELIYEPTLSSFSKDTKQTSDSRETTVQDFISSFFPPTWAVKKGPIYSINGCSREIDCVLLAPNHPPLITPKRSIILAEGVFAAIEIKPDISVLTANSEFHRGLMQIKSVKELNREIGNNVRIKLSENEKKIPCVIFTGKSTSASKTIEYMVNLVNSNQLKLFELPDLVVTMDNGLIYHTINASNSLLRSWLANHGYNKLSQDILFHIKSSTHTLALFLYILYNFNPPEPFLSLPILSKYLKFDDVEVKVYSISDDNTN